jgi:transposase
MLIIPSGVKVHLALGYTDMRKGFDSLTVLVQEELKKNPFSGHLFAFRGRKAHTIKILFWDGSGLCLFTKRLEHGRFIWPSLREPGGTVTLTRTQLAMLIEGVDWLVPERIWKLSLAG